MRPKHVHFRYQIQHAAGKGWELIFWSKADRSDKKSVFMVQTERLKIERQIANLIGHDNFTMQIDVKPKGNHSE